MATEQKAGEAVRAAKARLGLAWAQLAEAVGQAGGVDDIGAAGPAADDRRPGYGGRIAARAGRGRHASPAVQPTRGTLDPAVPADPTIYRFYEVLQVYGPTIKELIHEQFGDGIMSAINFRLDVRREPDPGGDRVIVTLNGKFLPYQW